MRLIKLNLFSIIISVFLILLVKPEKISGQVHILYTTSINGALMGCNCPGNPYGGIDRIIGTMKDFKATHKNVLTIDSGDFFGTYPDEERDAVIWNSINNLPYDFLLPGDQEFIYGIEYFNKKTHGFKGRILRGALTNEMSQLIDHEIITFDEHKLAIIGWHMDESFSFIKPKDLHWKKEIEFIKNKIISLKSEVQMIILVNHVGFAENEKLVKAGIHPDVIICGHSQETINKKIGPVLLVQAGMEGEMIGHLEVFFRGKHTEIANHFIKITAKSPVDREIRQQINDLMHD